jgi:catechol 2,3-dioxygenase-like lactoylglutathione lyase family enzyme
MKRKIEYTPLHDAEVSIQDPLRRRLLQFLALSPLSLNVSAQSLSSSIAVEKLHCFALRVTNVQRSLDFYQSLFGMPVQARNGDAVCLRIGDGPQFLSLQPCLPGEAPGINHIGLSVPPGEVGTISVRLDTQGLQRAAQPPTSDSLLSASMQYWSAGSADAGMFFTDREGLLMQICSNNFCGSADGDCDALETAPGAGLLQLREINHFTNYMTNAPDANLFYMDLFGLRYQSYQGPTMPTIGVGDGRQFLMFVGGAQEGVPLTPARIDHVSLSVSDFNVERILAVLTEFGLSARQDPAVTPALSHWISLRMPNRGGAEGGTPELYFSDPDGLHIQLQHVDYCGGGGYLGDECAPLA